MSRRDRDFVDERDYVDVRVREREQERERDPLARYFQEDRRSEPGALVLRQRDVETVERPRPRPRSPSPAHYREVTYARSVSPMPPPREREVDRVEVRDRVVERERPRQFREPSRERVTTRFVGRERERSPAPSPDREREIRIIDRSRRPSPSPSPSPPPAPRQVIHGPVVEREVITHYTDVDHGVVYAPRPAPPSPPRQPVRERDTEIDIYSSRRRTEVDIHESTSRERKRSQSRSRLRLPPARSSDKEVIVRSDRNRLDIDIDDHRNRRSHSAQPTRSRYDPVAEEARYIESRINERGEIGEAHHGATRDWTIVDVPPGTERVRMDGAGGGGADITWQRYNGVRRTRFIPDRDDEAVAAPRHKVRQVIPDRERSSRDHINVQITDQGRSRDREIEVGTDRHMVQYPPPSRELVPAAANDMWTEITKDLVSREAMDRLGYDYNETEYFYYILEYLRYEDVQELVQLSDQIRKNRRKHHHQSRSEVDIDVDVVHRRQRSHSHHRPRREEDRLYEREVVVDRHLHPTYYR